MEFYKSRKIQRFGISMFAVLLVTALLAPFHREINSTGNQFDDHRARFFAHRLIQRDIFWQKSGTFRVACGNALF